MSERGDGSKGGAKDNGKASARASGIRRGTSPASPAHSLGYTPPNAFGDEGGGDKRPARASTPGTDSNTQPILNEDLSGPASNNPSPASGRKSTAAMFGRFAKRHSSSDALRTPGAGSLDPNVAGRARGRSPNARASFGLARGSAGSESEARRGPEGKGKAKADNNNKAKEDNNKAKEDKKGQEGNHSRSNSLEKDAQANSPPAAKAKKGALEIGQADDAKGQKQANRASMGTPQPVKRVVKTNAQLQKERELGLMDAQIQSVVKPSQNHEDVGDLFSSNSFFAKTGVMPSKPLRKGVRTEGLADRPSLPLNKSPYPGIDAGRTSKLSALLGMVRQFPYHAFRSVASGSLRVNIASAHERHFLIMKHKQISTVMMNLLAWRRSVLACAFLMGVVNVAFQAFSIVHDFSSLECAHDLADEGDTLHRLNLTNPSDLAYLSARCLSAFDLPTPSELEPDDGLEPFNEFTLRVIKTTLQRLTLEASRVGLGLQIINLVLQVGSVVLTLHAAWSWSEYHLSRRSVLGGWLVTVFTPFVLSMIPLQFLVDWSSLDGVADDYEREFRREFNATAGYEGWRIGLEATSESFTGIVLAIGTFQQLVPAALSIAPAIIRGAMRAKSVCPQSSLPGTFILVVPWLYCPLAWALFNVFLQILPRALSPLVFVGLLLLAVEPMAYFFLGTRMSVTSPMTDDNIDQTLKLIKRTAAAFTGSGYVLLIAFLAQLSGKDNLDVASRFLNVTSLVGILLQTMLEWLYTEIAGIDYMVGELATERKHELALVANPSLIAAMFSDSEQTKSVEALTKHRDFRLDEFVRFTKVR